MRKILKSSCILFTAIVLLTSCEKDPIPPKKTPPPVANAGSSQVLQLPVKDAEVILTGTGTSINGKIVGYLWSLISGPNVPVIASPSSTTTFVKGLIAGTYIFQFAVIDSIGLTGVDTVSVLVKPSLQKIATIQPANNVYEGHIDSYNVTSFSNGDTQFDITAWTAGGSEENQRACLKLDFTGVSATSVIDSAVLYLYATIKPHGGNNIDANYGLANSGYIQRITGAWPTSNQTYSWNNQPSTTTVKQVVIPQSTSSTSNTVLNITELVRDMQQFGNNGFFMKLQNEQIYNIQQYASSFNIDPLLHPKLVIWYH